MVDMAHYAGLIAAGHLPEPDPARRRRSTSTTHKTLRGPRGGLILMKPALEKPINSAVFPGLQGGPLMHVIAAKAVAFKEALAPEFKTYQQQVLVNARTMAETLVKRGLRIVSGRTESHLMLVDLRAKQITGKDAEAVLGQAHITINKNAIPKDPEKPMVTSGIRLGSPGDDDARLQGSRSRADRQPDRRRARQPARSGHDRPRPRRSRGTDRAASRSTAPERKPTALTKTSDTR